MENFSVPILFLIFNRLETTKLVFEEIKKIKPKQLFVASDGPRMQKEGEDHIVEQVRKWVLDNVDWDCEVKTLFRNDNLGCRIAVSSAISWFFEQVEEGIILEDDCLPNPTFFRFCRELLEKYRDDNRIMHISGNNFQDDIKRGQGSYYFSIYNHIWGWATWRRAWQKYDLNLDTYPEFLKSHKLNYFFPRRVDRLYWNQIFEKMKKGELDTWDFAWFYSCLFNDGLSCLPNINIVTNIGINHENATHPTLRNDMSLVSRELSFPLIHPEEVAFNKEADLYTTSRVFVTSLRRLLLLTVVDKMGLRKSLIKMMHVIRKII